MGSKDVMYEMKVGRYFGGMRIRVLEAFDVDVGDVVYPGTCRNMPKMCPLETYL